jgi:hypothetical protein
VQNDGNTPIRTFLYLLDSKTDITNSARPESTLQKKSNFICYHDICESVAMVKSLLTHVGTANNLANLPTKPSFGAKWQRLVGKLLHDIYDGRKQKKVTFDK